MAKDQIIYPYSDVRILHVTSDGHLEAWHVRGVKTPGVSDSPIIDDALLQNWLTVTRRHSCCLSLNFQNRKKQLTFSAYNMHSLSVEWWTLYMWQHTASYDRTWLNEKLLMVSLLMHGDQRKGIPKSVWVYSYSNCTQSQLNKRPIDFPAPKREPVAWCAVLQCSYMFVMILLTRLAIVKLCTAALILF